MTDIDLAYHWSQASRRKAIRRVGLKPGALSRNRAWRPPFVCFSRDPAYAIESAEIYHPIAEPMDLWQVNLSDLQHESLCIGTHDELRVYVRIPYRDLTFIATRQPEPAAT